MASRSDSENRAWQVILAVVNLVDVLAPNAEDGPVLARLAAAPPFLFLPPFLTFWPLSPLPV